MTALEQLRLAFEAGLVVALAVAHLRGHRIRRRMPVAWVVAREADDRLEELASGDGWSRFERPNLYGSCRLATLRAEGAAGAYVLPLLLGKRGAR